MFHFNGSVCPPNYEFFKSVVLNLGGVNKFPGGRVSPYAPYNLESLIIKDTNNYVCFYSLFEVRGLETKDNCWEAW